MPAPSAWVIDFGFQVSRELLLELAASAGINLDDCTVQVRFSVLKDKAADVFIEGFTGRKSPAVECFLVDNKSEIEEVVRHDGIKECLPDAVAVLLKVELEAWGLP